MQDVKLNNTRYIRESRVARCRVVVPKVGEDDLGGANHSQKIETLLLELSNHYPDRSTYLPDSTKAQPGRMMKW